jgi:formylglycine-generating enzyme required for sulfatase activity
MLRKLLALALACICVAAAAPVQAQKRLALVVGIDRYQNLPANQQLRKAVNDARTMRTVLTDIGFKVDLLENAGRDRINAAFDRLESEIVEGDIVFLFFSGHGISIDGVNYLLPADLRTRDAEGRPISRRAMQNDLAGFNATKLVADLKNRGARTVVAVFDACRDAPFDSNLTRSFGLTRGLEKMKPPQGVFVLYSAGEKQRAVDTLADDDPNPNSVFTRLFAPLLKEPGLTMIDIAKRLQPEVRALAARIGEEQVPAYYDEVIGQVVLVAGPARAIEVKPAPAPKPAPTPVPPRPDPLAVARTDYERAERLNSDAAWAAFLATNPPEPYASFARAARQKLAAAAPARAAASTSFVFGIVIQDIDAARAASLKLPRPAGALVYRIVEGGLAARLGIVVDDVITSINGNLVSTAEDVTRQFAQLAPGAGVVMVIVRGGSEVGVHFNVPGAVPVPARPAAPILPSVPVPAVPPVPAPVLGPAPVPAPPPLASAPVLGPSRIPAPPPPAAPPVLNPLRAIAPLSITEERSLKPKASFRECQDCPEMVVVPSGSYLRGSPVKEEGREKDEGPQRRVTIARPFAVGKFEVTFAEWDECVRGSGCGGYRPDDRNWGRGRHPVIRVSWQDAQAYVEWLSRKTGKTYRLLTEAEWEYAARAGTTTPFAFGPTLSADDANYDASLAYGSGRKGVFRQRTMPVGSFRANAFGLHDMHGNVWEWVADCYVASYANAPVDGRPAQTPSCKERVARGGSFFVSPRNLRSSIRDKSVPSLQYDGIGFRVARTLTP